MQGIHVIERIEGTGKRNGIAVILDFPNALAWARKQHLQQNERDLLFETFKAVGLHVDPTWITFAVSFYVKDRKIDAADIAAGREFLFEELRKVNPSKILVCGGTAYAVMKGLTAPANVRAIHGEGFEVKLHKEYDDPIYCVATYPPYMILGTGDDDAELFRDFSYDIYKLKTKGAVEPLPKTGQLVCANVDQLRAGLSKLEQYPFIVCDTETSGLFPAEDVMEAIGFGVLGKPGEAKDVYTVIIPYNMIDDSEVKDVVREFMLGTNRPFVFHNAKFDLQFLTKWLGQSLMDLNVEDTIVINYLLDERGINKRTSPHGLKNLSRVRYDAPNYKFDFAAFWSVAKQYRNWDALYKYLSLDLYYTGRLFVDIKQELQEEVPKVVPLYNTIMMPGTKCLAEIELRGTRVDIPYLKEFGLQLENDLQSLSSQVKVNLLQLGMPTNLVSGFNVGSPKQIGEVLFDRLRLSSGKKRSTAKEPLNELIYRLQQRQDERANAIIELLESILEYRGLSKLLGTYVTGLIDAADSDGFVHTSFNLNGTGTGRLSSERPNLQNIPQIKGLEIRRAFIPRDGYMWVKPDYSQLEYRIAAFLCQDPAMIQAFINLRDIHIEVASKMLGISYDAVTKLQRYYAKFVGFGLMYGRTAYGIANGRELRGHNWTEADAQKFINTFLDQFPLLREWMNASRKTVATQQMLESVLGRRRRWPFINAKILNEAQRQGLNFPIQSLASDVTTSALIHLHKTLDRRVSAILITVHDEIDMEVLEDHLPTEIPKIVDGMRLHIPFECNVPIEVEVEVGRSWGELEKWDS